MVVLSELVVLPLSSHFLQRKEVVCFPLLREILIICSSGGVSKRQLGQTLDFGLTLLILNITQPYLYKGIAENQQIPFVYLLRYLKLAVPRVYHRTWM